MNFEPAERRETPAERDPFLAPPGQDQKQVNVVVPYRKRELHLNTFKAHMKAHFTAQFPNDKLEIWIIEQFDNELFNRAWLGNVGIAESFKTGVEVTCIVFHDVDLVPQPGVPYTTCDLPTQLSSELEHFNWGVPYPWSAGGVVSMSPKHWKQINGLSNDFEGWGGEDDDLHHRLKFNDLLVDSDTVNKKGELDINRRHIHRPPVGHGRFNTIDQSKDAHPPKLKNTVKIEGQKPTEKILIEMKHTETDRWKFDGLADLEYGVLERYVEGDWFHHLKVVPRNVATPEQTTVVPGTTTTTTTLLLPPTTSTTTTTTVAPDPLQLNYIPDLVRGSGNYKLTNPTGKEGREGSYSWSQIGQDAYVDKVLGQKRDGFFIEIGGYDGESHSNSLFFERQRGWDGLLVEANPHTFQQMVGRDRKCNMAHACISRDVKSMKFQIAGGLTSALETATSKHLARIERDTNTYKANTNWEGAGDLIETKCTTLNALLDSVGVNHVDYFSLDVEGAELHVLRSIDWDRVTIDVFTIEVQENRDEINRFMEQHGYRRDGPTPFSQDDVYVRIARETSPSLSPPSTTVSAPETSVAPPPPPSAAIIPIMDQGFIT